MPQDSRFHLLDVLPSELPATLNNPFLPCSEPLCRRAATIIAATVAQNESWSKEIARRGKMFGTLIVRSADNTPGFLAAYSGNLNKSNNHPYFVPPIFDATPEDGYFRRKEAEITAINRAIEAGEGDVEALAAKRAGMSAQLQQWLFEQYVITDIAGNRMSLGELFARCHNELERLRAEERTREIAARRSRGEYSARQYPRVPLIPPAAAGDCAVPKLLQYAFENGYTPLALAEFWLGASNVVAGRESMHCYGACRGKCYPILTYMLHLPLDIEMGSGLVEI